MILLLYWAGSAVRLAQARYFTIESVLNRGRCFRVRKRVGLRFGDTTTVIPAPAFAGTGSSRNPGGVSTIALLGEDDAFGIKWVPAFAGTTGGMELGSFLRIFWEWF